MKEFEIFIVRFKKKKGVFTNAQVNKLIKGIFSSQYADEQESSTNDHPGRRSGPRKKKVKGALQY